MPPPNSNQFLNWPRRTDTGIAIAGIVASGSRGEIHFTDPRGNLMDAAIVPHPSGPDGHLFEFDSAAKSLRFKSPTDFNNPSDQLAQEGDRLYSGAQDNDYLVTVTSSGIGTTVAVRVVATTDQIPGDNGQLAASDIGTSGSAGEDSESGSPPGAALNKVSVNNQGVVVSAVGGGLGAGDGAITITLDGVSRTALLPQTGPDASPLVQQLGLTGYYAYEPNVAVSSEQVLVVYSGERAVVGGGNYAQFFSFDAEPIGSEIWLTSQTNQGHRPGVGALSDGSFLAVWQTNNPVDYPELGERIGYIVARRIGPDGSLGETFIVAVGTNLLVEGVPPVISEHEGKISIAWSEYSSEFGIESVVAGRSRDFDKSILGGEGDDVFVSFSGNDSIDGLGGNDSIDGGSGADALRGGEGSDRVEGGDGDDEIWGDAGNDALSGGAGFDEVNYEEAEANLYIDLARGRASGSGIGSDRLSGFEAATGGAGSDRMTAGALASRLEGGGGKDRLTGGNSADTLLGGDGDDTVSGGAGNDLIVAGDGAGNDSYDGGTGIDTVKYTSALANITVNLATGVATSTVGNDVAGIGNDRLKGIENIISGEFDDVLTGSSVANSIEGKGGNDTIDGGLGKDTLVGGSGADIFVFSTKIGSSNFDTITDFEGGVDRIQLSRKAFTKLAIGSLDTGSFVSGLGAKALDADDFLIFNGNQLLYDADGAGRGTAVVIVNLVGLQASDIFVVA